MILSHLAIKLMKMTPDCRYFMTFIDYVMLIVFQTGSGEADCSEGSSRPRDEPPPQSTARG